MDNQIPTLFCPACNREYDLADGHFACPAAGDGREHVLDKQLKKLPDPQVIRERFKSGETASFALFREFLGSHALAGDEAWTAIHGRVQSALENHEGRGFRITPLKSEEKLAKALGLAGVFAKHETGNVTGSHKGRHLMGTLLYMLALEQRTGKPSPGLAVYSCGNAALAAAAVARAGNRTLRAFVPDDVNPVVESMLNERGADVNKLCRTPGQEGDPCYLAFADAITRRGLVPFSCSGGDNWSNIEGGETLGLEAVLQLAELGARVDHAVVQVGGGALGRSLVKALREAKAAGLLGSLPRIHACQPAGGFPFVRAYLLALAEISRRAGLDFSLDYRRDASASGELAKIIQSQDNDAGRVAEAALFAREHFQGPEVQSTLADMVARRGRYMWAWDGGAPESLAHGILDDETYDWFHLLEGLLMTGGRAVVLSEEVIAKAASTVRGHASASVCHTGTAGTAGLMELQRLGAVASGEQALVLFTGTRRE